MNAYRYRDRNLHRLGFNTYGEYLASELWKSIRVRVLSKQKKCPRCEGTPSQVHHTDYGMSVLSGRTLIGLIALCRDCHEWVEFCQTTGRKLSLEEANRKLHEMIGALHCVWIPARGRSKKEKHREKKTRKQRRNEERERLRKGDSHTYNDAGHRGGKGNKPFIRNISRSQADAALKSSLALDEHRKSGLLPHQKAARGRVR